MEIYERIKARRKELGLSADDVADALGCSRATIYRYESKQIEKMPTTVLEPLSKVLRCTPGYLMGWEGKDPEPEPDERAKEFIELFTHASPDVREAVVTLLKSSRPAP